MTKCCIPISTGTEENYFEFFKLNFDVISYYCPKPTITSVLKSKIQEIKKNI